MVAENKIEKLCCFYVSDFHLEMILIPYLNKKIEEDIVIKTEKNLKDTIEILISKMGLSNENKEKILNLGWNCKENNKITDNSNIIIIGSQKYIDNINNMIKENNIKDATVVDCYNFEEIKDELESLKNMYKYNLNTRMLEV